MLQQGLGDRKTILLAIFEFKLPDQATRFCHAVTCTCVHSVACYLTSMLGVACYLASELSNSLTSMQCHGMHYCGEKYDLDPIPKKGPNRLIVLFLNNIYFWFKQHLESEGSSRGKEMTALAGAWYTFSCKFYLFICTTIILCVSVGHIEICESLAPVKIGSVSFKSVLHFSCFIKFIW